MTNEAMREVLTLIAHAQRSLGERDVTAYLVAYLGVMLGAGAHRAGDAAGVLRSVRQLTLDDALERRRRFVTRAEVAEARAELHGHVGGPPTQAHPEEGGRPSGDPQAVLPAPRKRRKRTG